jgi:hypothetical protein
VTPPAVRLDPAAASWLTRKGGAVTLRASPRHGCCGGTAHLPVAEAGAPDDPAGWPVHEIRGITVYVDPALTDPGAVLTVRVEGFGRWRRLFVEEAATDPPA